MISVSLSMGMTEEGKAEGGKRKRRPPFSLSAFRGGVFMLPMSAIDELRRTIARLRAPDGCPWDQEQTHQSLTRCLIDECSELLDTIDRGDLPHMREELGDVLIQVIFHAQLAEEAGSFDLEDVIREVTEKLVRRHPHVFGEGRLATSDQVMAQWEKIKAEEKARSGRTSSALFKELPPRLPALMFAEAVWKQIAKRRLPAEEAVDTAQVRALAGHLTDESLGRMLFEIAAAARVRGLDPEGALRRQAARVVEAVEKKSAAP
jgi:MazG family protein